MKCLSGASISSYAVVSVNGYGHGAVAVAGGVLALAAPAVATVDEG